MKKYSYLLIFFLLFISCNSEFEPNVKKYIKKIDRSKSENSDIYFSQYINYDTTSTLSSIHFEYYDITNYSIKKLDLIHDIKYDQTNNLKGYIIDYDFLGNLNSSLVMNIVSDENKVISYENIDFDTADSRFKYLYNEDRNRPYAKKIIDKDGLIYQIDLFEWNEGNLTKVSKYFTNGADVPAEELKNYTPDSQIQIHYDRNPNPELHMNGIIVPRGFQNINIFNNRNNPIEIRYIKGQSTRIIKRTFTYDEDGYPLTAITKEVDSMLSNYGSNLYFDRYYYLENE